MLRLEGYIGFYEMLLSKKCYHSKASEELQQTSSCSDAGLANFALGVVKFVKNVTPPRVGTAHPTNATDAGLANFAQVASLKQE